MNLRSLRTIVAGASLLTLCGCAASRHASLGSQTAADEKRWLAPHYPAEALRNRWEGRVVLRVLLATDGHPASVEVRRSSGHDVLDNAARECVAKWTFPAGKSGPITVPITFAIHK